MFESIVYTCGQGICVLGCVNHMNAIYKLYDFAQIVSTWSANVRSGMCQLGLTALTRQPIVYNLTK